MSFSSHGPKEKVSWCRRHSPPARPGLIGRERSVRRFGNVCTSEVCISHPVRLLLLLVSSLGGRSYRPYQYEYR
jgi:hypothetical protein